MTLGDDILSDGIASQLEISGEAVTFRGQTIMVLIDRNVGLSALEAGEVTMRTKQDTMILVTQSQLDLCSDRSPPRDGESFVDVWGLYHRINSCTRFGDRWECDCSMHQRQ